MFISHSRIPGFLPGFCMFSCMSAVTFFVAFTDIEMIFDEKKHAVDWIFCYGNEALARIEKMPLDELISSSFGSLFSNMDLKWLNGYERATLYGEALRLYFAGHPIDK